MQVNAFPQLIQDTDARDENTNFREAFSPPHSFSSLHSVLWPQHRLQRRSSRAPRRTSRQPSPAAFPWGAGRKGWPIPRHRTNTVPKSAANWFPRTENVQPDEMRIIFMGTRAVPLRPGQVNTSILVQLGNGDNFIFDLGDGCVKNIIAVGFALKEFNKVFMTHLHIDHFG